MFPHIFPSAKEPRPTSVTKGTLVMLALIAIWVAAIIGVYLLETSIPVGPY